MATMPAEQSKLREALKKDYVKTAILIVIIIGSVLSFGFGTKAVLRTENPFMAVASPSMVPTLNVGDLIVVQGYADPSTIYAAPSIKVNGTTIHRGDIVVFWHYEPSRGLEHWVHRAVGEKIVNEKRYLITLGDANHNLTDSHRNITTYAALPGLPAEYIIGKVVANVPFLGQVALSLQTPEGRIIIIVLVVALIIVEFIPFPKRKEQEQVKA